MSLKMSNTPSSVPNPAVSEEWLDHKRTFETETHLFIGGTFYNGSQWAWLKYDFGDIGNYTVATINNNPTVLSFPNDPTSLIFE